MPEKQTLRVTGVALVILAAGFGAYAAYPTEDREVAEARQIMDQAFAKDSTPEQRSESFQEIRTKMESLDESQRRELWSGQRERFEQDAIAYTKLSDEEKVVFLDERIDRMQQMRANWEQRRAEREQEREQNEQTDGPDENRSSEERGDREGREERGRRGGPPGAPPGWGRGDMSEAERNDRQRDRLDNSTPHGRAAMGQLFQDIRERMQERGIQPPQWRGGRG